MNKLALAAAAALTVGTFGLAAVAQSTDDFDKFDGNKDGFLTYEEALGITDGVTQAFFDQADANGDAQLDETEFVSLKALLPTDAVNVSSSEASSSEASSLDSSSSSSSAM